MRNLRPLKKFLLQLFSIPVSLLLGYVLSQVFLGIFALEPLGFGDAGLMAFLRFWIVPGIFAAAFVALSAKIAPVLRLESAIAAAGLVLTLDAIGAVRAAYLGELRWDAGIQSFSASVGAVFVAVLLAKRMPKPPPDSPNAAESQPLVGDISRSDRQPPGADATRS